MAFRNIEMAEGAELDLAGDETTARVAETLASLEAELVGLDSVKNRVREIASVLQVDRARGRFGLSASKPPLHMSLTGARGTGKATVAARIATILHTLGYLEEPRVEVVTPDDLVGPTSAETATMTTQALSHAAGGVLHINEADQLARAEQDPDHGETAIEILLTEMKDEASGLVVLFAGTRDRMESFFATHAELRSLVRHHIEFDDYSHEELLQMAELLVAEANFRFDEEARVTFSEYLTRRMDRPNFYNARSVRNAIERCRLRQARRLVGLSRPLTKQDLITITDEDIRGSSLFDDDSRREDGSPH